ncbi:hypothetical protein L1887_42124 [Cichorium endivia]|nr:hypothetical protein L1887_42124 [Cichorium endivia]
MLGRMGVECVRMRSAFERCALGLGNAVRCCYCAESVETWLRACSVLARGDLACLLPRSLRCIARATGSGCGGLGKRKAGCGHVCAGSGGAHRGEAVVVLVYGGFAMRVDDLARCPGRPGGQWTREGRAHPASLSSIRLMRLDKSRDCCSSLRRNAGTTWSSHGTAA